MINSIWFKIIAGKINTIPEFYMIFARNDNEIEASPRPNVWGRGRNQSFEAEAKSLRPKAKFWPRGHFGLEDLTLLVISPSVLRSYSQESIASPFSPVSRFVPNFFPTQITVSYIWPYSVFYGIINYTERCEIVSTLSDLKDKPDKCKSVQQHSVILVWITAVAL